MNSTDKTLNDQALMLPRRGFFGGILGAAALGLSNIAAPAWAQDAIAEDDGPNWPGVLKGRHKQLVDAYEIYKGAPLLFACNFLRTSKDSAAVIVLRYQAFPLAMNHSIWKKYKIGEMYSLVDPATGRAAERNPYFEVKAGVLKNDEMSIDHLIANGAIIGGCALALAAHGASLAASGGLDREAALKEWRENVIPGITILPSGIWGVNRAQEAGCAYCSGGN